MHPWKRGHEFIWLKLSSDMNWNWTAKMFRPNFPHIFQSLQFTTAGQFLEHSGEWWRPLPCCESSSYVPAVFLLTVLSRTFSKNVWSSVRVWKHLNIAFPMYLKSLNAKTLAVASVVICCFHLCFTSFWTMMISFWLDNKTNWNCHVGPYTNPSKPYLI